MSTYSWDEVESLFVEAVGLAPEERARLLDERCADRPALRQELDSLLASHDLATGFLHAPTDVAWRASRPHDVEDPRLQPANARPRRDSTSAGRLIAHYRLVEWLASGGMGDVFRADDLALGRAAAVKLLPKHVHADVRHTVLAEAEASARLQHPAIATFYEASEADGETYIAMEYVPGRTLRQRLREGAIACDEAVSLTCGLLEALAHAHLAGLVHRDIKPENVMVVARGVAKLLDFGIAIPIHTGTTAAIDTTRADGAAAVTTGPLVGTLGYLAPEQVTGGRIDARTDLFQVGVVLYEMLTGRPLFRRDSLLEALEQLEVGVWALDELAGVEMPAAMLPMVRRALAHSPDARYQTASAFLRDLRTIQGRRPARAQIAIAVTDFENQTGEPQLDWVGSAIADSLRARLETVKNVKVLARRRLTQAMTTSEAQRGDVVAAALRLGCDWLVNGETKLMPDGRISCLARQIDVAAGCVRATHDGEGRLETLFALQDRLFASLGAEVTGAIPETTPTPGTPIEAHEYVTRARRLIDGFGKGSLEDARELLEQAIALDERHLGALGALATTYGLRAIARPNHADYESAVRYADRALAVDPRHVPSWVWKSYALTALGRQAEAEDAVQKALEIAPHDTEALYFAAGVKLLWRRPPGAREAVELLQRAVAADENRGMWWLALGAAHRCLGRHREALYSFRRAVRLEGARSPFNTAGAHAYIGETLRRERRLGDARPAAFAGLEAVERSDHAYRDTFRAHALTVIGRIAHDDGDPTAAAAAFGQVLAQARGRPHPRACGHFVVQALGGLARATADRGSYAEACRLFQTREAYNFDPFYGALEAETLHEIALAAAALGEDDAQVWFARAKAEGGDDEIGQSTVR